MSDGVIEPGPRGPRSAGLARNWWALALRGLFGILFGVLALTSPGAVWLSLAWLFAAYLLANGAFAIVASVRAATHHGRWTLLLLEGVLNLGVGALALVFPAGAVFAFIMLTAAWAIVTGALMLVSAFRVHESHGAVWMGLAGALSILWGALIVAAPMLGLLVLTWWFGAYAILFGALLLILSFRLRSRHVTTLR